MSNSFCKIKSALCMFLLAWGLPMFNHVHAQESESEFIFIDGEKWHLLDCCPILKSGVYDVLKTVIPKSQIFDASNWGGYWSLKNDMLVLDSVRVATDRHYCIPDTVLKKIFSQYVKNGQIVASWFSKNVRAGKGKWLLGRSSFEAVKHFDTEMELDIQEGRLTARRLNSNGLLGKGFSLDHFNNMPTAMRDSLFNIDASRYPELKEIARVFVQIRKPVLDVHGNLLDCQVKANVNLPDGRKEFLGLADDFKRILMNIKPWQVYRINGKLVNGDWDDGGYYIPVKLHQ